MEDMALTLLTDLDDEQLMQLHDRVIAEKEARELEYSIEANATDNNVIDIS